MGQNHALFVTDSKSQQPFAFWRSSSQLTWAYHRLILGHSSSFRLPDVWLRLSQERRVHLECSAFSEDERSQSQATGSWSQYLLEHSREHVDHTQSKLFWVCQPNFGNILAQVFALHQAIQTFCTKAHTFGDLTSTPLALRISKWAAWIVVPFAWWSFYTRSTQP